MRPFVKIIGIAIGMTGLLGGALLSMGHLQSAEGDFQQLELARLRNLAGSWETQLLSVRSAFRDQLLRHDVTTMVEHPAEWAGWRVENKLSGILDSWPPDAPRPRGWALLRSTGEPHAVFGDTSGLADALVNFQQPEAPDIMLSGRPTGPGRFLAMQYAPPADDQNPEPGRLLALVDPQSLFAVPTDPPAQWALMNGPKDVSGLDLPVGATDRRRNLDHLAVAGEWPDLHGQWVAVGLLQNPRTRHASPVAGIRNQCPNRSRKFRGSVGPADGWNGISRAGFAASPQTGSRALDASDPCYSRV
ncbi:MAG: hypothetical protein IPK53_14000 [bacterium]|nr:hypothetical protein [bacterium]